MNKKIDDKYLTLVLILFAIMSVVVNGTVLRHSGFSGCDLIYYWRNSAYSIRGYSLEWIKCTEFSLNEIGFNPGGGVGILPYGRLLMQIILPGFLPYNVARIYYRVVLVALVILIMINVREWLRKEYFTPSKATVYAVLICFVPWIWGGYLRTGNIGGVLALIAVLMAFYADKNENLMAALLALTLIKPQIGGIFVIMLFIKKRYMILIKTAGICVISYVLYIIYVFIMNSSRNILMGHENALLGILEGYAGSNMESERGVTWFLFYGIFNLLRNLGVPNIIVLALSMLAGIGFVVLCISLCGKLKEQQNYYVVYFAIAQLASLFWFYKSECDALVLIGCNLLIFIYWNGCLKRWKDLLLVMIYLAGLNCLIGRYILRFLIPILSYNMGIFLDQVLQIGLFLLLLFGICKNKSGEIFYEK